MSVAAAQLWTSSSNSGHPLGGTEPKTSYQHRERLEKEVLQSPDENLERDSASFQCRTPVALGRLLEVNDLGGPRN